MPQNTEKVTAAVTLRAVGKNQHVLDIRGRAAVLFSYNTAVAASVVGYGWLRHEKPQSATTARHISAWVAPNALRVPGHVIESVLQGDEELDNVRALLAQEEVL